ncbi:ThiF family adenylyltransferase [Desulfurobacterium sp.]
MDRVTILEEKLVPYGKLVLLGAGRLGVRVFERLVMTHRGGFSKITVFDGGTIEENDYYHILKGALPKENKASFLKRRFLTPDTRYKEIEAFSFDFSESNIDCLEDASVVVSTIAGGDTIPLVATVGKFCIEKGIPFITTNGVFGFGDEEVGTFISLASVERGPALFLKEYDFPASSPLTAFIGTGILIKDGLPISPIILDRVADAIAIQVLKFHQRRKCGRNY